MIGSGDSPEENSAYLEMSRATDHFGQVVGVEHTDVAAGVRAMAHEGNDATLADERGRRGDACVDFVELLRGAVPFRKPGSQAMRRRLDALTFMCTMTDDLLPTRGDAAIEQRKTQADSAGINIIAARNLADPNAEGLRANRVSRLPGTAQWGNGEIEHLGSPGSSAPSRALRDNGHLRVYLNWPSLPAVARMRVISRPSAMRVSTLSAT